jgi:hypothetical protein
MRWGQGFFRAWVVLSIIWVGLAVYIQEPTTYRLPWLWRGPFISFTVQPVGSASSYVEDFDLSKSQAQLADDVTRAVRLKAERSSDREASLQRLPADRDQLLGYMTTEYEKRSQEAKSAWLTTIAPPFALLGLGLSLSWVLRGFRTATQRPISE